MKFTPPTRPNRRPRRPQYPGRSRTRASGGLVQAKRFVGLVLHIAGNRIRILGVLAKREYPEEHFVGPPSLVNQPKPVGLRLAARVSIDALDFPQPPLQLGGLAQLLARAKAIGTRLRPGFGDCLSLPVTRDAWIGCLC